jgi:hypothetical protein
MENPIGSGKKLKKHLMMKPKKNELKNRGKLGKFE